MTIIERIEAHLRCIQNYADLSSFRSEIKMHVDGIRRELKGDGNENDPTLDLIRNAGM